MSIVVEDAKSSVHVSNITPTAEPKTAEVKYQFPGVPATCDGAEAVVQVETRISQGAGAFPITSSTTMGGGFNAAVMNG